MLDGVFSRPGERSARQHPQRGSAWLDTKFLFLPHNNSIAQCQFYPTPPLATVSIHSGYGIMGFSPKLSHGFDMAMIGYQAGLSSLHPVLFRFCSLVSS